MFKFVAGSTLLVRGPQQYETMTFATRVRSLPSLLDTSGDSEGRTAQVEQSRSREVLAKEQRSLPLLRQLMLSFRAINFQFCTRNTKLKIEIILQLFISLNKFSIFD